MKKVDIVHIYSGTSGTAGTYLAAIYDGLKEFYSQELIVNYFYPFSSGKKIFYKFTELAGTNFLKPVPLARFFLRFLELFFALLYSYFYIIQKKPRYVNYSMTSNIYIEYIFLKLIKLSSSAKLIITCHDVMPNANSYSNLNKSIKKRRSFFNIADILLVHNANSKSDLIKGFDIPDSKIIFHLFPIMDLSNFSNYEGKFIANNTTTGDNTKILFIGHMRKEKGIELLLNAWFKAGLKKMHLTVAGNVPPGFSYSFEKVLNCNFTLIDDFLSDNDYINLIKKSDFVVLPYTGGTNSGIPSSIISLGSIPIVSNIPMFKNNELLDSQLYFTAGSEESLSNKLTEISLLPKAEINQIRINLQDRYLSYQDLFKSSIQKAYKSLDQ